MATAAWDPAFLTAYLKVPETAVQDAITKPTAELVRTILEAVLKKAREHEEAEADKLRFEVELENAVRSSENRAQVLKSTIDKSLHEVNDLREKLNAEGL
jgi:nucleoprotein TPR